MANARRYNAMTDEQIAEREEQEEREQQDVGETPHEYEIDMGQQHSDVVTLVLTANNRLGYSGRSGFGQQVGKREERQRRLRQAFQQATDFAIGQGVDLFIQAGDLFDTVTPDERDRSFVAARLAQLRQASVRVFALGGTRDTPIASHSARSVQPHAHDGTPEDTQDTPAPQLSYARLGALTYFPPGEFQLEPVIVDVHGVLVGLCGLGISAAQEDEKGEQGDPLARMRVSSDIERAAIPLLILHAPIEGLAASSSLLESRALVRRASIEQQSDFRCILAGYHHAFRQLRIGRCDVIVAGSTQRSDFSSATNDTDDAPGFVFLGLDTHGIRWCKHIAVDALALRGLTIHTGELWTADGSTSDGPTDKDATATIIERLRPLCDEQTMVRLSLEGALTRGQYHQLDLNRIRRFGEEHAFALAIDDSRLSLRPEDAAAGPAEAIRRFSARAELMAVADEWIAAAPAEEEKKALSATREAVLAALDEVTSRR